MNWDRVKISDCVSKVSTVNPSSVYNENLFKYVDIASIDNKTKTIGEVQSITGISAPSRARQVLEEGDILVSTVRPNLNAVALVTNELNGAIGSTGFCVLRPINNTLHPRYLFYWVRSRSFISEMEKKATGASYPAVSDSIIKNSEIPLPPLPIQQQIADTLDKADALRRKDQELLDMYDELAQAVFYEMFGDPVRNEKGWMAKKLSDLSSHISSGSTPLGGQNVYIKEGVLFIRSQNVLMRKFDITDAAFISEDIHNKMKRTWVKANDVLLNITGASIGRVATYKGPDDKANVNQHVCIIRTKTEYLTPDFLMYLLSNNSYQSHIIGKSAGGTRESFTFSQIKNFDVILPPILLQLKFTKIIESIKLQAELSSESIEKSSQFFLSLMNSYFKN